MTIHAHKLLFSQRIILFPIGRLAAPLMPKMSINAQKEQICYTHCGYWEITAIASGTTKRDQVNYNFGLNA
jgi:hypothetical protein